MDYYYMKQGKVKFECYRKEMHEKYAKLILRDVNSKYDDYIEAMEYTRKKKETFPDKYCTIMLYVSVPTYDGILEARIDFRDGKHQLSLCELTRNCSYRFAEGRLLFAGYPCWDYKSELRELYERLNIDPKKVKEAQERAKQRVPSPEELLPPSLAEKVNTRKLKALIEEKFPSTSPAYRVIMPERDEMSWFEYQSKFETWMRVIKVSAKPDPQINSLS
ncbi:MAG: hypothetical protein ACYCQJ_10515 [Nitrososphaerales archaeon]